MASLRKPVVPPVVKHEYWEYRTPDLHVDSKMSLKNSIKNAFLPSGRRQLRILAGPASGLIMELDLQSQSQRLLGLDEREIAESIVWLADKCKSLVDIGANDGYYTLIFLRSPARQVVACEPGPVMERLVSNAAANNFAPNKRFSLIQDPIGTGAGAMPASSLVNNLPGPVFIKMEVDGAEIDVLLSCEDSKRLRELYWLVETHSPALEDQCSQWFCKHGYRTKVIANAWWRLILPELRPLEQNRWLLAQPK